MNVVKDTWLNFYFKFWAANDIFDPAETRDMKLYTHVKGKGFPYSLPSVRPGANPGAQAVSLQVIHPAVGCRYFPPGLRLPSQP